MGFIDGTMSSEFSAVKLAFENNYACMGITCAQVGGLMLNDGYYDGASPCEDTSAPTTSSTSDDDDDFFKIAFVVAVVVVALLVVAIAVLYCKMQSQSTEPTTQ